MAKVTELVAALAAPIAEQNGCTLWDVEYVREAGQWFLRVYIDKPEGISINDCEAVSRPLSDALDEADPIEGSYVLEVSSAGADRPLKKPAHFQQFLGAEVDVRLYRPLDGRKEYTGVLKGYDGGDVTIETAGEARHLCQKGCGAGAPDGAFLRRAGTGRGPVPTMQGRPAAARRRNKECSYAEEECQSAEVQRAGRGGVLCRHQPD